MTIMFIVLATGCFFLEIFLTLRFGSDHPIWPKLLFYIPVLATIFVGDTPKVVDSAIWLLLILLARSLGGKVSFLVLRRRAGTRILTYNQSISSLIGLILSTCFFLFMGYLMSLPNIYIDGKPVYDDFYYRFKLPYIIIIGLMGVVTTPAIFRRGEFFENGIATPNMQYYPWDGYKTYKWIENSPKKSLERFSLFLDGGRNYSHTIHGFSESTKSILDELLKKKFPNQISSS